jgi:hypothetical protein
MSANYILRVFFFLHFYAGLIKIRYRSCAEKFYESSENWRSEIHSYFGRQSEFISLPFCIYFPVWVEFGVRDSPVIVLRICKFLQKNVEFSGKKPGTTSKL